MNSDDLNQYSAYRLSVIMKPNRRRPLGITLLALPFLYIGCLGTLIFPFMMGTVGRQIWDAISPAVIHSRPLSLTLVVLIIAIWFSGYVLYAFLGVGLWKVRAWALKGSVLLHRIFISIATIAVLVLLEYSPLFALPVGILSIAPFAGILWYLSRPTVQAAFNPKLVPAAGPIVFSAPPPAVTTHRKPTWRIVVSVVAACMVGLALFAGSLLYAVDKIFRQSDVYSMALASARNSPCVISELGTPLIAKGTINGNINTQGPEGSADFEIPVRGPKSRGSLNVSGKKVAGRWAIDSLTLMDAEGQIQLLPIPSAC